MGGKTCWRCKCKTLLGIVNKLLKTKCVLTSPSKVFPSEIFCWRWWDPIQAIFLNLFYFWKKLHLALGNLAKLVLWSILSSKSLKIKHLVHLNFFWWQLFLREREKIVYKYSRPKSLNADTWEQMISYFAVKCQILFAHT